MNRETLWISMFPSLYFYSRGLLGDPVVPCICVRSNFLTKWLDIVIPLGCGHKWLAGTHMIIRPDGLVTDLALKFDCLEEINDVMIFIVHPV